mmetsp:Transcript_2759/g.8338  ORF Transcript_2759/g.8338 Transcript_2759/m.8338 type:complete len:211 (+) Transcript_2759:276-908(+)
MTWAMPHSTKWWAATAEKQQLTKTSWRGACPSPAAMRRRSCWRSTKWAAPHESSKAMACGWPWPEKWRHEKAPRVRSERKLSAVATSKATCTSRPDSRSERRSSAPSASMSIGSSGVSPRAPSSTTSGTEKSTSSDAPPPPPPPPCGSGGASGLFAVQRAVSCGESAGRRTKPVSARVSASAGARRGQERTHSRAMAKACATVFPTARAI